MDSCYLSKVYCVKEMPHIYPHMGGYSDFFTTGKYVSEKRGITRPHSTRQKHHLVTSSNI